MLQIILLKKPSRDDLLLKDLNAGLNTICSLLALLQAYHILHVSRIRVKRRFTQHISVVI